MGTPTTTCYCLHCKKDVTFHIVPVNHKVELIRTIVTVGLWLPIWLFSTLVKTKVCDLCGGAILEQ